VNFDPKCLNGSRILQIAIQAVRLFDKNVSAVPASSQIRKHRLKLAAAGALGCFGLHELALDDHIVFICVFAQQLPLGRDAISQFLFGAGDTGIEHAMQRFFR
jgi:hypothetical protein